MFSQHNRLTFVTYNEMKCVGFFQTWLFGTSEFPALPMRFARMNEEEKLVALINIVIFCRIDG